MDIGSTLDLVGTITKYLAVTPLIPAAAAVGYGESPRPFLLTAAIAVTLGVGLELAIRGE